jgi:hypothetical protein
MAETILLIPSKPRPTAALRPGLLGGSTGKAPGGENVAPASLGKTAALLGGALLAAWLVLK